MKSLSSYKIGFLQFLPKPQVENNIEFIHKQLQSVTEALITLPEFFLLPYHSSPGFPMQDLSKKLKPLLELSQHNELSLFGSFAGARSGSFV
jgi:predicted amidohydrolase